MKNRISMKDREILRRLAAKQYEYSQLPIMKERQEDWYKHNDLKTGSRPMMHVEVDTFEHEIIKGLLECEGEEARRIEWSLYHNILSHEYVGDDRVVADYYGIGWNTWFRLFDIDISRNHATDTNGQDVGHKFNHIIQDLEDDYHKLGKTQYGINREETLANKEHLEALFGDILPIKLTNGSLYAVPTQKIVHLMGMENMLYNIYDYPELFKELMNRVADDYIEYFRWLGREGILFPALGNETLAQGSFCYTRELKNKEQIGDRNVLSQDIWGFMDSQETVGMSPEMFAEFIFPTYYKIGQEMGRLSYGCCEPVHPYWNDCISKFDNLHKVSISPWCDEKWIGEKLRERKSVIYHRKPSPNFIGVGKTLDEDAFRVHITDTVNASRGCKLEIAQRDVYTLSGDISKLRRYVEIIREECEKHK